jgi:hypothetical protein
LKKVSARIKEATDIFSGKAIPAEREKNSIPISNKTTCRQDLKDLV